MALTKEQLSAIYVGQTLYATNGQGGSHFHAKNIEITKIGREYFYTKDGRKWERSTGNQVSDYTTGTIYLNEESYRQEVARQAAWEVLKRYASTTKAPDHLSTEDIQEIAKRIKGKE